MWKVGVIADATTGSSTIEAVGIICGIIVGITGAVCSVIYLFQNAKQTRVFIQANELAAGGKMTLPPNPSRNSYWLPIVSTSIWIALTAMIWSAVLYDVGNRRDSVLIVVCISLITILILFIIAWRTVAASLRQFNPRDIVYADYGSSERGFHYWTDAGGTGETLADYLRELFERPTPERLTNELLRVHDPATTGPHKILRFKLSDGRCFLLYEYGVIRIDTAIRMPPFEPFVKNTAPSSLSTTYQPDEVEYAD